jgi:hypothetical protein
MIYNEILHTVCEKFMIYTFLPCMIFTLSSKQQFVFDSAYEKVAIY